MPLMLPSLLSRQARDTRFATHMGKPVPHDESRVSLLLSVCGYLMQRGGGLRMRGSSGKWLPVQMPNSKEPMLEFLRRICARDWPVQCMDANDERLDVVFASI